MKRRSSVVVNITPFPSIITLDGFESVSGPPIAVSSEKIAEESVGDNRMVQIDVISFKDWHKSHALRRLHVEPVVVPKEQIGLLRSIEEVTYTSY